MTRHRLAARTLLCLLVAGLLGFAAPAHAQQYTTGIAVSRSCPATAAVGETITITITVTNTGNEPLKGIKVIDTLFGDVGASFADNMDVGGSETRSFTHVVSADDPDPLVGSVKALTEGAITDESENATASCQTDVGPPEVLGIGPRIAVSKSCPSTAQVGTDAVYTVRITNTGDESLSAITVQDSMFGDVSGAFSDSLAPGATEERVFTHHVGANDPDPLVNTVSVKATGAQAETTDSASCTTDVIAAAAVLGTKVLAASGAEVAVVAWSGLVLMLAGAAMIAASRRENRI
jgi:uncharacterized repeat protein (TIGR01451 family)